MARMTDYSPVALKLWTAVFLEGRGKPAALRWLCCRAGLFANVFGCIRRHGSSEAYVRGLHWKKTAFSLRVRFLFWQIHLNLVVESFVFINRALIRGDQRTNSGTAVSHLCGWKHYVWERVVKAWTSQHRFETLSV